MKLYIVYFRTMENSPEVEIRCATTNKELAKEALKKAKKEAKEWMKDVDEDSGDWAEACMEKFDMLVKFDRGEHVFVAIETVWHEVVETTIAPFFGEDFAKLWVDEGRRELLRDYPGLTPFDEDEALLDAMHLEDPDVAVDVYFSIETVVIE